MIRAHHTRNQLERERERTKYLDGIVNLKNLIARGRGGESAKGTGSGRPGGEAGDGRRFRDHRGKLFPPHRCASGRILGHYVLLCGEHFRTIGTPIGMSTINQLWTFEIFTLN